MLPEDRKFLESHEWAKKDGDIVTVGITAFAVEHLSDLTYLDLPEVGTTLEKGERFGEIESVKAVSELMSPVSGEVVEVNEELPDALDQLTEDSYDGGWMIKIKVSGDDEYESLLDGAAYQQVIDSEEE